MLQQAQNVQTVAISPWLLLPAVPVTIVILAFNFLGDGLRDAADPYGSLRDTAWHSSAGVSQSAAAAP